MCERFLSLVGAGRLVLVLDGAVCDAAALARILGGQDLQDLQDLQGWLDEQDEQDLQDEQEAELTAQQVLGLIRKAGTRGHTVRELGQRSRKFAALDARGQESVLASLEDDGDICMVEFKPQRGPNRVAWIEASGL